MMNSKETFHDIRIREAMERAAVDSMLPGLPDALDAAHGKLTAAADELFELSRRLIHEIATTPQKRLEMAALMLTIPGPIIARLVDDLGPDDIERLLVDIERGIAELRAAARQALPKAAE